MTYYLTRTTRSATFIPIRAHTLINIHTVIKIKAKKQHIGPPLVYTLECCVNKQTNKHTNKTRAVLGFCGFGIRGV